MERCRGRGGWPHGRGRVAILAPPSLAAQFPRRPNSVARRRSRQGRAAAQKARRLFGRCGRGAVAWVRWSGPRAAGWAGGGPHRRLPVRPDATMGAS